MKIHEVKSTICCSAHWSSSPSLQAAFGKSRSLQGSTGVAILSLFSSCFFSLFLRCLQGYNGLSHQQSMKNCSCIPQPTPAAASCAQPDGTHRLNCWDYPGGCLGRWWPLPHRHLFLEGVMLSVPHGPAWGTLDADRRGWTQTRSAACGHPWLLPQSLAKLSDFSGAYDNKPQSPCSWLIGKQLSSYC